MEKASAAANLSAYMSVQSPNWEPMAYNITGSAPWVDVQTVGWNAVKIGGNVGIGDGSYRALKLSSTPDIKFADTGSEFMAADISTAPLDYSRMSGYTSIPGVSNQSVAAQNNTTENNSTGQSLLAMPEMASPKFDKVDAEAANNTSPVVSKDVAAPGGMTLNDPYHAILMGRPVGDMLYEDPLAQSVTMYGRLVGFQLPSGCCANIGIRTVGYGY